jgi:hypothetical protein
MADAESVFGVPWETPPVGYAALASSVQTLLLDL